MKLSRNSLSVTHRIDFPFPVAGLMTRGGQLVEAMTEALGSKYPLSSSDVSAINTPRLQDWALRFALFNGLVTTRISAESIDSNFRNLSTEADIAVAIAVESTIVSVVLQHTPSLRFGNDRLIGSIEFEVLGGERARDEYFKRMTFPGRSSAHTQPSFKFIYVSSEKCQAICEIAPRYDTVDKVFASFDVDLAKIPAASSFEEKASRARVLVDEALSSVELEVQAKDA